MADARDQAAALVSVSGRYVSDIKRIALHTPEKLKELEAGTLTLQGAKRQLVEEGFMAEEGAQAPRGTKAMKLTAAAISELSKIRKDDPKIVKALEKVLRYADRRLARLNDKARKIKPLRHISQEEQVFLFKEHELGR